MLKDGAKEHLGGLAGGFLGDQASNLVGGAVGDMIGGSLGDAIASKGLIRSRHTSGATCVLTRTEVAGDMAGDYASSAVEKGIDKL
jgi:hypothetical protein